MPKEHVESLNILKGISIFFVVCIHITFKLFTSETLPFVFEIYNYMTGFAVPIFMIAGGFFFGKKFINIQLTKNEFYMAVKSCFKRLVIPYYIVVIILSAYNFIVGKNIFWKHFFFIDSNEHGLYFLIIYTYSFLLSLLLRYIIKRKPLFILALTVISIGLFYFSDHAGVIEHIVCMSLPLIGFFSSGVWLYFLSTKLPVRIKIMNSLLILLMITIIFTEALYAARKFFGPFPVIQSSPATIYFLIYSILFFILGVCLLQYDKIRQLGKFLKADIFGVNSLFIFLIHPFILKAIIPLFKQSGIGYDNNLFFMPYLVFAYVITYSSARIFDFMPYRVQMLFSR